MEKLYRSSHHDRLPQQLQLAASVICCIYYILMDMHPALAKPQDHITTNFTQAGIASIYTPAKKHQDTLTLAHRTLPLGTHVEITNRKKGPNYGRTVCASVDDRGPYIKERIADLSPRTADEIGLTRQQGLTPVMLRVVSECPIR